MKSTRFLPFAAALFAIPAPAQAPAPQSQTVVKIDNKPNYSGEPSLFERLDRVYTYAADGTGSRTITGVIRVQTDAAVKQLSVINFPFASASEHVALDYLRVVHPDGSITATPAADAQEQPAPVTREAPFYSDLKEEQVPVRSLAAGDRLEYQVHIIRTKAEAPNHFWGREDLVTPVSGAVALEESVEIRLPTSSYIQVWSPNYTPTVTDAGGQRTYHFASSQLIPVAGKDKKALLRLEKHPDLSGEDSVLPDIEWTNFHTWKEVGEWYRSLEGSRTEPTDDIKAKVTQLIEGKATPEEKTRAIYGFVGPQIRYIGVAFGIGRYQPHEAADILSNQYGDCKDKTTLLTSMLAAAGITADAALIGADTAFNEDVPSPGAFNHVITLAHVADQPTWLDSTAEIAPYRLLVSALRGKRTLVIPLTGDPHLDTTPKDPPFPFKESFNAVGSIDDKGTSNSKISMDLRGDEELVYRQTVRSVSPAQWDDLMQHISYNLGYIGKVTNATFARPEDTGPAYHLSYDYQRDKSGDWDNLRILPQLPPFGLSDVDEKDPPVLPIELAPPGTWVAHAVMKLPPGWSAELPVNIHAKSSFATFDKTYKLDNGALITDRRIVVMQEKLPASQWREFHQWFKDAGLEGENFIQLVRAGQSINSNAPPEDPQATQLIHEAAAAFQQQQWEEGKQKLDAAKKINSHQRYLWGTYGALAEQYGKVNEAIEDYQRELRDYPNENMVSGALAYDLRRQGKVDEAVKILEQAIAANPNDTRNVSLLQSIYLERKDYAASEKLLRTAIAASPDNDALRIALSDVLISDHKPAEAKPLLIAVAASSSDPIQLNNAAYTLADNDLDLATAEAATRKALGVLAEASANGETGKPAFVRSELLINTWDTFGWILFREGKFAEALPWLRAGWVNGYSQEEGFHLGAVQRKSHQDRDALGTLQLAAKGRKGNNADATAASIQSAIDDLTQHNIQPDRAAPYSLQQARTYLVPRPDKLPAFWATVDLEITSAGTQSTSYFHNDNAPPSMLGAVKSLDLHLAVPPDGGAHLFRRGVLSCHTGSTCDLVLEFPEDASRE